MNVGVNELRDPEFIKSVAKEIFESADVDGSGYLDRDELNDFLDEYFTDSGMPGPKPWEVDDIIRTFDRNKDNKFSLEEFTNLIKMVFEKISKDM